MAARRWFMLAGIFVVTALGQAQGQAPSCTFDAGALPVDTLPAGTLHGAQIPINHIVVLMQENRSYDHYFGRLNKRGAERLPPNASNPDPLGGKAIRPFHQKAMCEVADLDHSWTATHIAWNGGAMDGFTTINVDPADPSGRRAMGGYRGGDLGYYYALYKIFATADRYFASALTQTFPNRFYLVAGTSFGHIRNDFPGSGTEFSQRTIFEQLDEAGVSWKSYAAQISENLVFAYVRNVAASKIVPVADFATDANADTLPQVSFVEPIYLGGVNVENDEHPPANVQVGEAFAAGIIDTLLASPSWASSVLFLTYDEHGGFWDHVPPPAACQPDGVLPLLQPGDEPGDFDRYGVRVPTAVISPFAKKRFVSHRVYDHTSVLRFIQTRFDLPALTKRDANADPMLEMFDFANPPFVKPPKLPKAKISTKRLNECTALHP